MAVMKQKNIRQAEKTLREMVDKADRYGEGKVELEEFIRILESSNIEVSLIAENPFVHSIFILYDIWNNSISISRISNLVITLTQHLNVTFKWFKIISLDYAD